MRQLAAVGVWTWCVLTLSLGCSVTIEPGQAEPGEIGASCEVADDCLLVSDPVCLRMGDGYCAKDCTWLDQFGCPSGSVCDALGDQAMMCLDGCCTSLDCRPGFRCARRPELDIYLNLNTCSEPGVCLNACSSDASCEVGYRCELSSGDCVPRLGEEARVGAACVKGDDCNSGSCLSSFPGGYCTSPCGTHQQRCEPGSDCNAVRGGASTCMQLCVSDQECRAGYRCEVVSRSADNDKVKAFCVPRCEDNAACQDGSTCDAASGVCVEGSEGLGGVGAFCSQDADCESGRCETSYPNGYCTQACTDACVSGACDEDLCLKGCQGAGDCRSGYSCIEGGCRPACTGDEDCSAGQVCDTATGACAEPVDAGELSLFHEETITVTDEGSDVVRFTIPSEGLGAIIHLEDAGGYELLALNTLRGPDGTLLFDIFDPSVSSMVVLPSAGSFTALFPSGPSIPFVPGDYEATFVRNSGSALAQVTIYGKLSNGFPVSGGLDVLFTFVGSPEGLNAASAASDSAFQTALEEFRAIYLKMGVQLAEVRYQDLTGSLADRLGVVDSVEGSDSELAELFSSTEDQGQSLTFFCVEEIVGGEAGYIILGIAGGIPGPARRPGTSQSGVAVTMLGFREAPEQLGQTMAHEAAHFLGLFHTSEANGNSHDPLPDTPECSAASDFNFDGRISSEECADLGSDNFMFWLAGDQAREVSVEQGRVLRRNPGTR